MRGGEKEEKVIISRNQVINAFKYHVSCTDGKISVRIIYFSYLIFHRRSNHKLFLSIIRSQEKNSNQNRDSKLGPPDLVRIFLLRPYNAKFPKAQIMRFGFN